VLSPTFAAELADRRERCRSLLLLYNMNNDPQIQAVEEMMKGLISADPDVFLVEIKVKPTNNIKVYLDGDQGVSIERLVQFNRKLYKQIEEENRYPDGNFSLEVSSPGLDEPLKMHRQYLKNINRFVEVLENGGAKKEGKLIAVNGDGIVVEELRGKGKKQETISHTVLFTDIKTTKIQIKF
jgi:ribosome maturation factor RimP